MTPFDFLNSINHTKLDLFDDPQAEKDYAPFVVNRSLSYFPDTVLYANAMNANGSAPKEWQFDFLLHAIPKRKRFSKWVKKQPVTEDLTAVCNLYKYSTSKGLEALSLLSVDQIQQIKQQMDKGGKS